VTVQCARWRAGQDEERQASYLKQAEKCAEYTATYEDIRQINIEAISPLKE